VNEFPERQPTAGQLAVPAAQRTTAALIHASALLGWLIPVGLIHVLAPLIAWLALRDGHPSLDDQGKEALNFNLSVLLYGLLLGGLVVLLVLLGVIGTAAGAALNSSGVAASSLVASLLSVWFVVIPVTAVLALLPSVLSIVAAVRASQGVLYRYPLTIRFVR
jgi:uncharacterized protein